MSIYVLAKLVNQEKRKENTFNYFYIKNVPSPTFARGI